MFLTRINQQKVTQPYLNQPYLTYPYHKLAKKDVSKKYNDEDLYIRKSVRWLRNGLPFHARVTRLKLKNTAT